MFERFWVSRSLLQALSQQKEGGNMGIVTCGRDRDDDRDPLRHSPTSTERARFQGSRPFELKGWGSRLQGSGSWGWQ